MAASYRDLITDPFHAARAYHHDFGSYATHLIAYSGRVLDIGGGNGLVRHFLAPDVDYICLIRPPMARGGLGRARRRFSVSTSASPVCPRSRGYVPFADGSFDGVLAFWSLNHCADPKRSLFEIARVLRPGGLCLLVLEDVEPPWRDIFSSSYRDWRSWSRKRLALEKCKALLFGWPVSPIT